MRKWVLLLTLAAAGCTRCDDATTSPAVVDAGPPRIHRSTDLRTAVFTAYPEFRGARVMEGNIELVRTFDRTVPLDGEVLETVKKNGFAVLVDGGTLIATRSPYTLRIDGPKWVVSLPLVDEDIGKLLGAPVTMTTEQIALWFPKAPHATLVAEHFHLMLTYDSIAWRSGYLAWQMVEFNTRGSWKVDAYPEGYEQTRRADGGGGLTPMAYSLWLVDTNTSARIDVQRDGGFVRLDYLLRTEEIQWPTRQNAK